MNSWGGWRWGRVALLEGGSRQEEVIANIIVNSSRYGSSSSNSRWRDSI